MKDFLCTLVTLAQADRFADAREWARAALRDYEASGNADENVMTTAKLLELIESAVQAIPPPQ